MLPVALCIAGAVAIRVALVLAGWPGPADSDEATMGLMARHIAAGSGFPLVFYGQPIIGPLEAYTAALLFGLLGPTVVALRLGLILLFVPFLLVIYGLTRLLYTRGFALAVLALFALGSPEMLAAQLFAGGHAETPLYCAALLAGATALALAAGRAAPPRPAILALGCAAWGGLAGFAIWGDPLVTPFVLAGAAVLLRALRHGLPWRAALPALLGFAAGIAPLVVAALAAGAGSASGAPAAAAPVWHGHPYGLPAASGILGALAESLPLALGANAVCPQAPQIAYGWQPAQALTLESSWPGTQPLAWADPCTGVHLGWGLLVVGLGALAFGAGSRAYRRLRDRAPQTPGAEAAATRRFARLALLGGAGLTLLCFVLSPAPATEPWSTRRYLVGLVVALPALLWPVWQAAGAFRARPVAVRRMLPAVGLPVLAALLVGWGVTRFSAQPGYLAGLAAVAPAVVWAGQAPRPWPAALRLSARERAAVASALLVLALPAVFAAGTLQTFASVPAAQANLLTQTKLIQALTALGATRVYTDYWTCDRLAFASGETIACATLDASLAPDLDRYAPYRALVATTPHPWYVFPAGSPQAVLLAERAAAAGRAVLQIDGYVADRP